MYIREYCSQDQADGHDEGGFYRMVEAAPLPQKLKKRIELCSGCYNNFYNHRANCGGINHCYSLSNDENFSGNKQPKCWRR